MAAADDEKQIVIRELKVKYDINQAKLKQVLTRNRPGAFSFHLSATVNAALLCLNCYSFLHYFLILGELEV